MASKSSAASSSPTPTSSLTDPKSSHQILEKTGWAHSGSYSCTIPLLTEDHSTHDAISDLIRKKKVREIAALKAARLKKQQQMLEEINDKTEDIERERRESRENASIQVKEGRDQLNKLESDKASLERSVSAGWTEKFVEFEQRLSAEEKKELDALKLEHDGVVGKMLDELTVENNGDRIKLTEALEEVANDRKRKINSDDAESAEDATVGETEELQSVVKQKQLQTIMEEMNDLNKTKGQMVWLLKQVITSELTKKTSKSK